MCTIYKYIVIISHLARSVLTSFLLNLTTCCETHSAGRGSIRVIGSLAEIRNNSKPQHRIVFTTRRYRHITPPMDLARRNPVLAIISRISICLSVCLSLSVSCIIGERTHARVAWIHASDDTVDTSLFRLSLSRCAEILSWITINLSQ